VDNGLLRRCTICLKKISSGRMSWPVNFYLRASQGYLGKGWKNFIEAARLKEGDRCIFRLVSKNSLVVDVVKDILLFILIVPVCSVLTILLQLYQYN
jgi:B3 DNA binding domain